MGHSATWVKDAVNWPSLFDPGTYGEHGCQQLPTAYLESVTYLAVHCSLDLV